MRNCGLATQTIRKTGFVQRLFPCEILSSFVHVRGVMIPANLREIKPGFLIPTMKPLDTPKDKNGVQNPESVANEEQAISAQEADPKKMDFSKVEFLTVEEGLCVQCMHIGPYDDEPATVAMMHEFMEQQGYELDITDKRLHHEIYLSDARKVAPEKLKTVIRHPIKAKGE